jgi:hypothetical protein
LLDALRIVSSTTGNLLRGHLNDRCSRNVYSHIFCLFVSSQSQEDRLKLNRFCVRGL